MRFRKQWDVNVALDVHRKSIVFDRHAANSRHIEVELRQSDDDVQRPAPYYKVRCIATASDIEAPPDVSHWLHANTNAGRMSDDSWAKLPEPVRLLIGDVVQDLNNCVDRSLALLRWRLDHRLSPAQVLLSRPEEWSDDGSEWHPLPHIVRLRIIVKPSSREPFDDLGDELSELLSSADAAKQFVNEPVAHELWLEAWSIRESNPRSALMIGMTAAETGLKYAIDDLDPTYQVMARGSTVRNLLNSYRTKLKPRMNIVGKPIGLPEGLEKTIRRGADERNSLAHTGVASVGREDLEEILLTVLDLLYLLDVYRGFAWAANHLRPTTVEAWSP